MKYLLLFLLHCIGYISLRIRDLFWASVIYFCGVWDMGEYLGHGRWSCCGNMTEAGYFSVDDKI